MAAQNRNIKSKQNKKQRNKKERNKKAKKKKQTRISRIFTNHITQRFVKIREIRV